MSFHSVDCDEKVIRLHLSGTIHLTVQSIEIGSPRTRT
jgi:hypothetical protein